MAKTDFEKAIETISAVAQNLDYIANVSFEKAEPSNLHAVKRLVVGKNGERFYRTYWISDYQEAYQAQRDHKDMAYHAKKLADAKRDLDRKPDDTWYKDRHKEAQSAHDKAAARLEALEKTAVKTSDRKFKTKKGVPAFVSKQVELDDVTEQIQENMKAWENWSKEGPEKIRAKAEEDYRKIWEEAGLKFANNHGNFEGKIMSSDGKSELLLIQHRADYNFNSDSDEYEPRLEVRLRHSSFDTKDAADFAYMGELSDSLAKVTAVTKDPAKMKQLNDLRMKAHSADKTDTRNEFSKKGRELTEKKNQLEKEITASKVDDVIAEMGNDSFELKNEFRFETGRKHAPNYSYAKVVKTTPKQVEVAFSDTPGDERSFYNSKKMSTEEFRKFVASHVDLDSHTSYYSGGSEQEPVVANVVKPESNEKDLSKLSDSELNDLFWQYQTTHDKQPKKSAGRNFLRSKIDEIWKEQSLRAETANKSKISSNNVANAKTTAPSAVTAEPSDKKVVGHDTYAHPNGWQVNKGDKVKFQHNGETKEGTVVRTNKYQRFPNPYVLMTGADGKKYEIVISKISKSDDEGKK